MNDSARMSEVADPDAARYERWNACIWGPGQADRDLCNGSRRGPWPSSRRPMDGATNGARPWRVAGVMKAFLPFRSGSSASAF
jgi:hypothetical protein